MPDNLKNATDFAEALTRTKAEIVAITEELTDLKDELVEALSRESKLVDDISALTSGKDEFVNSEHERNPAVSVIRLTRK